MAKIVYLFAFVALFQVATALNCYSCDANTCPEESKWQKVEGCGKTVSPNNAGACLKYVYTDKTTNKDVMVKKCVIADKSTDGKVTYNCNGNEGKVVTCEVCTDDYCNSATAINFSFVTFLGVIVVFLIPKFM